MSAAVKKKKKVFSFKQNSCYMLYNTCIIRLNVSQHTNTVSSFQTKLNNNLNIPDVESRTVLPVHT